MRNYKRKSERTPITPDIFETAKQMLQNGLSKRRVASELGFSEGALRKRLKLNCGVNQLGRFKGVFNSDQELHLAEHARNLEKMFYGLTLKSLRKLAYQYAEVNNVTHPFLNEKQMAGKDWAYSFLKRHRLSLRTPSKTSVARAMGFNKLQVDIYFNNLKELMEKYQFASSRIFNMDESGLSTVPNKTPKVVCIKGQKQVGKIASAERGQTITVVCCMSAAGSYVPPAIIFPRKRRKIELIDGAPPDSILLVSDSGYINTDLFIEWLQHFQSHVKSSKADPTLLILDNHSSHTSLQAVLFARQHNIQMLSLPPHSSHKTQPLDRCFFKPLKDFYSQACEQWLINHPGRTITQYQVASLFSEAYERTASVGKAIKSFKTCGIFPMKPSVFTEEDFLPSTVTDQQEEFDQNTRLNTKSPQHKNTNSVEPLEMTLSGEEAAEDQHISPSTSSKTVARSETSKSSNSVDRPGTPGPSTSSNALDRSGTPGPSTSREVVPQYISPIQILPLPKRKDITLRKSKGKKSAILTSTPVKDQLEEAMKSKEKTKDKGKRNVFGAKQKLDKGKSGSSSNVKGKENKLKKTSFERKIEVAQILENSEENVTCPGCNETFLETPNDDWVQCNQCQEWWHDDCSPYEGVGAFKCDYCV